MHKNLPNGLKVSLELFRVGVFSRVDRVERVEVARCWNLTTEYTECWGWCEVVSRMKR